MAQVTSEQSQTGQRSEDDFETLRQEWGSFFSRPDVVAGLLQFGGAALTPGVSIGEAVSAGGAAAGRTQLAQQQLQSQEAQRQLQQRQVSAEERRAATGERRAATAERQAERAAQLSEQKLALEREKLEKYWIPSLNKPTAGKSPHERMFQMFFEAAVDPIAPDPDPETMTDAEKQLFEQNRLLYNARRARAAMQAFLGEGQLSRIEGGDQPTAGAEQPTVGAGQQSTGGPGAVTGAMQGAAQQQPQAATQARDYVVGPDGNAYPRPENITEEQWLEIDADEEAKRVLSQVYGEDVVRREIIVAKQRAGGINVGRQVSETLGRVMERNE